MVEGNTMWTCGNMGNMRSVYGVDEISGRTGEKVRIMKREWSVSCEEMVEVMNER